MKARLVYREKNQLDGGYILELALWKLPAKSKSHLHGYKYRLYFGDSDGNCLVHYDNESGKGDHKHIGNIEIPYLFVDRDTLVRDFYGDILRCRTMKMGKE